MGVIIGKVNAKELKLKLLRSRVERLLNRTRQQPNDTLFKQSEFGSRLEFLVVTLAVLIEIPVTPRQRRMEMDRIALASGIFQELGTSRWDQVKQTPQTRCDIFKL